MCNSTEIGIVMAGCLFLGFCFGYFSHWSMWSGVINAWKQAARSWKKMYYELMNEKGNYE